MAVSERANCPRCGAAFKTEGLRAGKRLKCPKCSQPFTLVEVLATGMPAAPPTARPAPATPSPVPPPPLPRAVLAAQAMEAPRHSKWSPFIVVGVATLAVMAGVVWYVARPGHPSGRDSAETPGVADNVAADPHGPPRTTHEQRITGLPEDKRPKPGPQGQAAREAANAWLKTTTAGKPIDVQFVVTDVQILDQPDGKHASNLSVTIDPSKDGPASLADGVWGGDFRLGEVPYYIEYWGENPIWSGLNDAEAARLRELKGQKITLRVQTNDFEFQEGDNDGQLKLVITFAKVELPAEQAPVTPAAEPPGPVVAANESKRPAKPAEEIAPEPTGNAPEAPTPAKITFDSSGPAGVLHRKDSGSILDVAWSPDGRLVAAFDGYGIATLWDVATARGRDVSPMNEGPEAAGNSPYLENRHVAFSNDGKTLVVGTTWKLGVIDLPSGKIRWETGAEFKQGPLIVNPGATHVAVLTPGPEGRSAPTLSVRNAANGQEVFRTPAVEDGKPIALSPGGKLLAIGDRGKIRLFKLGAKNELAPIMVDAGPEMTFSSNGRQLMLRSRGNENQAWDVSNPERPALVKRIALGDDGVTGRLRGRERKHVALSGDGRVVAGWKADADSVELLDSVTGASLITVNSGMGQVSAVALNADGGRIALGTGDSIVMRSAAQKSRSVLPVATLKFSPPPEKKDEKVFNEPPVRVGFSPDGKWLITGARVTTVWDLPGRRQSTLLIDERAEVRNQPPQDGFRLPKVGFGYGITDNGWLYHGDGRTLTVASRYGTHSYWHYDLQDQKLRYDFNEPDCKGLKSSPDGRFAVAWQHERGKPGTTPENSPQLVILDQSARLKKTLGTFNAADLDAFSTLSFSADSRKLAAQVNGGPGTSSGRKAIKVWEWETGRELPTSADAPVRSLNLIDSGRLLMTIPGGLSDELATLYDVQAGALRHTLELRLGHAGNVTVSAFAPVGPLFATGDSNGVLLLRDFTTGAERGRVQAHEKSITAIGFSKDGDQLATCAADGEIKVWRTSNLTSGQ